jgi:hypothetical protein
VGRQRQQQQPLLLLLLLPLQSLPLSCNQLAYSQRPQRHVPMLSPTT